MALLDDVKIALRVSTTAFDEEINMLIEAAFQDMVRVGLDPQYLGISEPNNDVPQYNPPSLVKHAICCYAKANFGYDNAEAERFNTSYRQVVCDLLNSDKNTASED